MAMDVGPKHGACRKRAVLVFRLAAKAPVDSPKDCLHLYPFRLGSRKSAASERGSGQPAFSRTPATAWLTGLTMSSPKQPNQNSWTFEPFKISFQCEDCMLRGRAIPSPCHATDT